MDTGVPGRLLHLLPAGRIIAHADVVLHRVMKQHTVLKHIRNQFGQPCRGNVLQIHASNFDRSRLRRIKAKKKLRQRGLSSPGGSYQTGNAPGRQTKRHLIHCFCFRYIGKRDVLKRNVIAVRISGTRLVHLFLTQNLINPAHSL